MSTPHVDVVADPVTDRIVITLDSAAATELLHYLDDLGPGYDLMMNPGHYGVADDRAARVADVVSRIASPLRKIV